MAQTHRDWILFWRDDGSTDATLAELRGFAAGAGRGRCVHVRSNSRLGPTGSFLALLRAALRGGCEFFAFADQDDVWLPDKLAFGIASLRGVPRTTPALYFARQVFVDERLTPLGLSERMRRTPGFPAALAQNVATGCTTVMNRYAAALVGASRPPSASYHDWWAYLLVAAAGGALFADERPSVLYRQHAGNLVGAPGSASRRALAALRRGPGVFMHVFRAQVMALADHPHLLSAAAREQVLAVAAALQGGRLDRLRTLRRVEGLLRQTWPETMLFRLWFVVG